MGRSPSFCFGIKACTGEDDEGDFSKLQKVKASPEKRRWSLRKKNAGRHAPIYTVFSQPSPNFADSENREANAGALNLERSPSDSEKVSLVEQISTVPKELYSTSTVLVDYTIPEHFVIVIQTSIRRCLAQNELQKLKYVVKLQAATRGFLVRRQAAGTLRCIQAIVKMQAFVRARHSVQSVELIGKNNLDESIQADVVKQSNMELNKTSSAIIKIVSNAFARQLLESVPKAKSIRISCDPMRPESAWNWLEKWMALISIDQQKFVLNQEKDMKNDMTAYDVDVGLNVISHHASSISELTGNYQQVPEVKGDPITKNSLSTELSATAFASNQILISPVQNNELLSHVQETRVMENNKDPEENEGGRALIGSRKSKNPAFAAVQAKFEELSSAPDSNRHFDYVSSDVFRVSKSGHSQGDFTSKEVNEIKSVHSMVVKEVTLNEKLYSHSPKGQGAAASGYVTEIYVSSRDIREDSVAEIVPEHTTSVEINHGLVSVANGSPRFDEIKAETKNNLSKLAISVSSVEAMQVEEGAKDTYVDKPLPPGSPRSHSAAEYSPTVLSSQISLSVRTARAEDNISAWKKSQLAVKNSPTSSKNDSDAQSSGEHIRKGTKNLKRPNSSGSDRTYHVDHEDRNSSNSLPGYMQLTESAKAKINTGFSHHNEKRHSLPIGNVKLGLSPRMRSPRSASPQYLKGNHVSFDKATERRWQI